MVTGVPCRSVDLPLFACFGKHRDAADGHAERQEEDTEGEEDDKDEDGTDTGAEGAEEEGNAEAGAEAEGTEEDTHSDKPPWPGKAVRCGVDRTAGFRPWRRTPSSATA